MYFPKPIVSAVAFLHFLLPFLLLFLLLLQLSFQLPSLFYGLPQIPRQRCHLLAQHHRLAFVLRSLPAALLQLTQRLRVRLPLLLQLLLQSRICSLLLLR
jgi:hypothetical protein